MLKYINLKYKPTPKELIAEYYVEPNSEAGITIEQAAEQIAAESSIGTWTDIITMDEAIAKLLKPNVFSIEKLSNNSAKIKIAYSQELFEPGNMPQIFSSIAGNIFGMKLINNLRLEDISFPKKLVQSFEGPAHGIEGIRKYIAVKKRPLIGTIIKPKVGLNPDAHARVAYEAWTGGIDIVKDDENLTSMSFNEFKERIRKTLLLKDRAELETGEKKIYMPNITAETLEMIRRADYVKKCNGKYMMIDILTAGLSGLQTLRQINTGLIIHAHRAGHAAITRNPKHGISMLVIAKTARLIGVDQLHIGTAIGKMEGTASELIEMEHEITKQVVDGKNILKQDWHGIKPVLPVCSGGLHPGHVPELIKIMGKDIVIQLGGGIHGHPDGTFAGAKAARQAIDAVMQNKSLKEYSKTHAELAKALEKFGWK